VSLFTIGWLLWIGWFVVEEGFAFKRGTTGNTLSEHVWKWFGIPDANSKKALVQEPITWAVRARRFALLAFLAWLSLHFLTGGRF
jgi:hypothetical protein